MDIMRMPAKRVRRERRRQDSRPRRSKSAIHAETQNCSVYAIIDGSDACTVVDLTKTDAASSQPPPPSTSPRLWAAR